VERGSGADGRRETVVPDPAVLTHVLPTERLLANGLLRPELRAEMRRIPNVRNALAVAACWAWLVALVAVTVRVDHPLGYLAAVVFATPLHVRFAILMHEAAHRLLFSRTSINDAVGTWLVAYPAFVPIALYRRGHMAHHREEFGANEPDMAFYAGYPCEPAALRRRLVRDAVGISGWKNLKALFRGLRAAATRRIAASILAVQALMWAIAWITTGRWYVYPVVWLVPWMTGWRVVNRLRAIAEHGGMAHSNDRRQTTHNIRQSLLARFWIVPFHTGWHLAHHVDMGVPWTNLPRFHAELERAGYVNDAITYPNYRALWRTLVTPSR
jgi:fatty acid desaturase